MTQHNFYTQLMESGTLLRAFIETANTYSQKGIIFVTPEGDEKITYVQLFEKAKKMLGYFQEIGVQPKDELVFQIDDNEMLITAFWACILGGIVPVPLSIGRNDQAKLKLTKVWRKLNTPFLLTNQDLLKKIQLFVESLSHTQELNNDLENNFIDLDIASNYQADEGEIYAVKEDHIAFIQFSSGSTGTPKGVTLTHKNLITNINAISAASKYTDKDKTLSWMPLTHDMGMIGFHLNPLVVGMDHYLIHTNYFIRHPKLWIDKASEHKISIICSPNFGYRYLLKSCDSNKKYDWNLDHVRLLYNGAEPISIDLCKEFLTFFAPYNLRENVMCPVYGLAEASLAVSISDLENTIYPVSVNRNYLNIGDVITPSKNQRDKITFLNLGKTINDCSIQIVNSKKETLPEETVGHILIKGDNVTKSYYNDQQSTEKVISKNGWLDTGDIGFLKNDCLYITGRFKNIIFVNGQNFFPHDIERVIEGLEEVELNKIVVSSYFDHEEGKEIVLAFVFYRKKTEAFLPLRTEIINKVYRSFGIELTNVIPVKNIPRTTSGKLQRFQLIDQYKKGDFLETQEVLDTLIKASSFTEETEEYNPYESRVLKIWQQVFGLSNLNKNTSFFELGVNSLKLVEAGMLLQEEFNIEISFDVLYYKNTITKIAKHIEQQEQIKWENIPTIQSLEKYPATSAQKRLFYTWMLDKTATAYNLPVVFKLEGQVNSHKVKASIKHLIARHDSLRINFEFNENVFVKINDEVSFELEEVLTTNVKLNETLLNLIKPFDLLSDTLFRIKLVLTEDTCYLFTDFSHAIIDGISMQCFIEEFLSLYQSEKLPDLPIQFKDYSAYEPTIVKSKMYKNQEVYWLTKLRQEPDVLELPYDYKRPNKISTKGKKIQFKLNHDLSNKVRDYAKKHKVLLQVVFLAAYRILLSKYSGKKDLIIGIPSSGRRHSDTKRLVGMLVNNLAIRNSLKNSMSLDQVIKEEELAFTEALKNQDYLFGDLITNIKFKKAQNRHPIFDTMFMYQSMSTSKDNQGELSISQYVLDPKISKFDISMEIIDSQLGIFNCFLEYATCLFKEETICDMFFHFENVLEILTEDEQRSLKQTSLLNSNEFKEYVYNYNSTDVAFLDHVDLLSLFKEQVIKDPENIAVRDGEKSISYTELDKQSDKVAQYLQAFTKDDHLVAVFLPKSIDFIIAIFGVLKSGKTFLPLSRQENINRINSILKISQCKHILTTQNSNLNLLPSVNCIDIQNIKNNSEQTPLTTVSKHNPAYIIYTSGSTGTPKGVSIGMRAITNYVLWAKQHYIPKEAKTTFSFFTSVSFDLTLTSILVPLISGNEVMVYNQEDSFLQLTKVLNDDIDVVKLTPSHLKMIKNIPSINKNGKVFIVGGEKLDSSLANEVFNFYEGKAKIFNEYGPTEATVGCMCYEYNPNDNFDSVPIGQPIANTQVYVLDEFLNPVPKGVHGELFVSGDGLSDGYYLKEALTHEKFIANPFIKGERMYQTGDIVKYLSKKKMQYVARSDNQIKMNGFRIELSEIEHVLKSADNIKDAVVTYTSNDDGDITLLGFIIANGNYKGEKNIKKILAENLPHYMIPTRITLVSEFPLTTNGKTDYDTLISTLEKESIANDSNAIGEFDAITREIVSVWKEILYLNDLNITDNFFELGGDSIKAIQITSKLFEKQLVVKVEDILRYPTVEEIRERIEYGKKDTNVNIESIDKAFNPTPIQEWFFKRELASPGQYNQAVFLEMNLQVEMHLVKQSFELLVRRFDDLRLNYNKKTNQFFYNKKHKQAKFNLNVVSHKDYEENYKDIADAFNLEEDLLLRATFIKNQSYGSLLITAHHLVMDAVSWRILLENYYSIYRSLKSSNDVTAYPNTINLITWRKALDTYINNNKIEILQEIDFWNSIENTNFHLPLDHRTEDWTIKNQKYILGKLEEESTSYLVNDAYKHHKTDLNLIVKVAFLLAIKQWTGHEKIVVATENHGRHIKNLDYSKSLGWYTTIFPQEFYIDTILITDLVKSIKNQIESTPNKGFHYLLLKDDLSQNLSNEFKMPEIIFNYLGQFGRELKNELFSYNVRQKQKLSGKDNTMSAKIECNIMVVENVLQVEILFNQKAHNESTILNLKDNFINNIEKIIQHLKDQNEVLLTPLDFQSATMTQEDLDSLFN